MKSISSLLIAASLTIIASTSFAAETATDLKSNWTCTTNASSSDSSTDKSADNQMSDKAKSASEAFDFASKNCRDCTKITCETNTSSND
jgi:hypothetical protein